MPTADERAPMMTAEAGAFWILGTDTEIGKTAVAAGLLGALSRRALKRGEDAFRAPLYVKPVQTGAAAPGAGDADRAREAGFPAETLFSFAAPASPALAAKLEGRRLAAADVLARIRARLASPEAARRLLILEGAGGLLVPLNERESMLDLVRESALPAVLVIGNRLGALNQARLSVDRLRSEGVPLLGMILNRTTPAEALDPGTLPAAPLNGSGAAARAAQSAKEAAASAQRAFLRDNAASLEALYGDLPLLADIDFNEITAASGIAKLERAAALIEAGLARLKETGSLGNALEAAFSLPDSPAALLALDAAHVWHPYANPTKPPAVELVESARDRTITILRETGGRPSRLDLIDGTSAWWCAPFGAAHPRLVARLKRQASDFPHVMFGGLTHRPAIALTERLLAMLPPAFSKVFYSDSGSVSIEVARKMALQYQQAAGRPEKRRFLVPLGGYHGDTAGAMSFCDPKDGMHVRFADSNRPEIFIEPPACRFDAPYDEAALAPAREAFAAHGGEIAAVVLEPVAQCAGGMRFYHPDYLRGLAALCRAHGALLIFDEIATGFGRTGRNFAFEHAGVEPDILCLGKALTGGIVGMAATVVQAHVAQAIGAEPAALGGGVFPHGPTYMANPLTAAVAAESLALYASRNWLADVAALAAIMREALEPARQHPCAADIRVLGAIGVIELKREPAPEESARMKAAVIDAGVWLRPFGRLIYTMPAFTTTPDEMRRICGAMQRALDQLHDPNAPQETPLPNERMATAALV